MQGSFADTQWLKIGTWWLLLEGQHSLGYVVAELHDLLFDIPKEGAA
jgi:hypothetical protein